MPIDPDKLSESAKQLLKNKSFKLNYPTFESYIVPYGFLERDPACQALFYYAVLARRALEENYGPIDYQYEGTLSNRTDFRALFESIAFLYGVEPAAMQRYWPAVDMQFTVLRLPELPKEDRYRHDKVPEFNTH